MKNVIFLVVCCCSFHFGLTQGLPNYDDVKLDRAEDYKPADTIAHQAADFLLFTPFDQAKIDRLKSAQFLIRWMSGTPDYNFSMDGSIKNLGDEAEMMSLYMA